MADQVVQLALVSQVEELATEELRRVGKALQTQLDRDFAPHWQVRAKLSVFPTATDIPPGVWPIVILRELDQAGTLGYHDVRDGVPFAQVRFGALWHVAASHQCLEVVANPLGSRLITVPSPKPGQDEVEMLVQICDPVGADAQYEIDGVLVADFVTPAFYGADGEGNVFDVQGKISAPLELRKGGYFSWREPKSGHWWQQIWFGDEPEFRDLGVLDVGEPAADEPPARPAAKRAPRRRAKPAPQPPPEAPAELDALGGLPGALNDQVAKVDLLGFRDYVVAFADLIESPHTEPPITIGIYGAWGSGKSFLLQGIEDELLERQGRRDAGDSAPRVHVVRFNAWEYSSSAAIWPSLVRKIVVCVQKELRWKFPGRFVRKLWRNLRWEVRQERAKILGALVTAALLLAGVLWQFDFEPVPLFAAAAGLGLAGLIKVVADTLLNPLSRWMTAVLKSGEYGEPVGLMNRIQDDLEQLSKQLTDENGRFVVMIDDLDRCEPDKVVEVLQAINLLLNFESFIVCLGIDARLVTGAIEKHYAGLLGAAGASGYEYLDKIVQIPFRIPRPNATEVQTFITSQLRQTAARTNGTVSAPKDSGLPPPPPRRQRAPAPAILTHTPGAEAPDAPPERVAFNAGEVKAFEDLAALLEPNPRHLKRLINVYRLVRSLAGVRHVESSVRRDPEGVILLLTLAAQWPYTAAAMLERVGPIVEREASGDPWPDEAPLVHLYALAKPDLILSRQRTLDRDPEHLAKLLARAEKHLGWKALDSLRRYVVNFNPAVEEELRRAQVPREPAVSD
jgi:hypothetical protein